MKHNKSATLHEIRLPIRQLAFVAVLFLAFASTLPGEEASRDSVDQRAENSDIGDRTENEWVELFQHDDFEVRESALVDLIHHKPVDLQLIERLCGNPDLEVASRAASATMAVFSRINVSDSNDFLALLQKQLTESTDTHAAIRTRKLIARLSAMKERIAYELGQAGLVTNLSEDGTISAKFASTIVPTDELFARLASRYEPAKLNLEGQPIEDKHLEFVKHLSGVKQLYLMRTRVTGSGLKHLSHLKNLEGLSLRTQKLEPVAFDHIAELKSLKFLGLDETNTTDRDLKSLEKLSNLQQLWLNDTKVTDKGLASLGKMANLEKLILTRVPIEGAGFGDPGSFQKLQYLSLEGCPIDNKNAARIAKLRSLTTLGLDKTKVTDESIKELGQLTNLKVLWLTNTEITDASVPYLAAMHGLERLILYDCGISSEGIRTLKSGISNCVVEFE